MDQIMNYVKPELIVVAVVLYFCGMGLKQSQAVKDKYIPAILGAGGILVGNNICDCYLSARNNAGDCDGSIYSDCARHFGGRSEYIHQSDN